MINSPGKGWNTKDIALGKEWNNPGKEWNTKNVALGKQCNNPED